jgi:hypothetical protein
MAKEVSCEEKLWKSAIKLRGGVETAEYKHVVLSLMSVTHNFQIYFYFSITNFIIFIIIALILYWSKINILYVN